MRTAAVGALKLYRHSVGLVFAGRCKYYPTCSQYAVEAVSRYGVLRGATLSAWRLARCNPWSHGGVDHVHGQSLFRRPAADTPTRPARR